MKHVVAAIGVGLVSVLVSFAVQAQQVYRIVGPDGRVTYSDQPPQPNANVKVTTGTGAAAGSTAQSLPFGLQQVVSRYPVTLYTGSECPPCVAGRGLLIQRGVPFTEKTVVTPEDGEALRRLSGNQTLPFLTIGSQQLRGFSDTEWVQFLDAAGYPKTSQLPSSYRNAPATPLVAVQRPEAPQAGRTPPLVDSVEPATPQRPAAAPANENPAGIRF